MTCGEFLARHSEYLDEELGAEAAGEMRLHIAGCARCARYDRVLRRGLALLRDSEPELPSTDGFLALHQHLARTTPPPPEPGAPKAPFAATIAVAGVVALVAWSAFFRATGWAGDAAGESAPRAATPDVASEIVAGQDVRVLAPPVVQGMDIVGPLAPRTARAVWPSAAGTLVSARVPLPMPGPYTPLQLRPPEFGQGGADRLPLSAPGPR